MTIMSGAFSCMKQLRNDCNCMATRGNVDQEMGYKNNSFKMHTMLLHSQPQTREVYGASFSGI